MKDGAKKSEKEKLIQFLDDINLFLVMREAEDDGRKALEMLRDYYADKGEPQLI